MVGILPMLVIKEFGDGKQYIPSSSSWYSALDMILRAEMEKESWKHMFSSEER